MLCLTDKLILFMLATNQNCLLQVITTRVYKCLNGLID